MSKYRLSREEWNQLDDLLGKHGYGGYYDLIEVLKMVLGNLGIGNTGIDIGDPNMKLTLRETTDLLSQWSQVLSTTEGFKEVAEKASLMDDEQ